MLVAGYDLDMSYITDRILAMSFPAERMRAMYRNPLWQVKSVLDMRHPGALQGRQRPNRLNGKRVSSLLWDVSRGSTSTLCS
ncbi:hypothetical protein J5N97_000408 [Dioscorea zingiberensis]|uniref:Uncharacterized protein n=1 Tax=Dioscorea zingiberensis TaxID=325984 RepID=A0A9D5BSQ0_9LILI|nr:hypothetical protein J5N97_000408 [Dioscorea zingiberensis]